MKSGKITLGMVDTVSFGMIDTITSGNTKF